MASLEVDHSNVCFVLHHERAEVDGDNAASNSYSTHLIDDYTKIGSLCRACSYYKYIAACRVTRLTRLKKSVIDVASRLSLSLILVHCCSADTLMLSTSPKTLSDCLSDLESLSLPRRRIALRIGQVETR